MLLLLKLFETVVQRQLLILTTLLLEEQVLELVEVGIFLLLLVLHTYRIFHLRRDQIRLLGIGGYSLRDLKVSGLRHKSEFLLVFRLLGLFDCIGGEDGNFVGLGLSLVRSGLVLLLELLGTVIVEGVPVFHLHLLCPVFLVLDAVYLEEELLINLPAIDSNQQRLIAPAIVVLLEFDSHYANRQVLDGKCLSLHIGRRLL